MNDLCLAPVMKATMNDFCQRHWRYRNMVIESAGLLRSAVGMTANEPICREMERRKRPLNGHRSRFVGDVNLASYDHILFAATRDYNMLAELAGSTAKFSLLASADETILPITAFDGKEAVVMIKTVLRIVPQVVRQL